MIHHNVGSHAMKTDFITQIKFSVTDFISKCDHICRFLPTRTNLLKKLENFIFCAVFSNGKILCLCLGQKEKNTIASGNANDEKKFNPGGLTFFTNLIEVLKKKFALKQLLKKRFSLLKNKESYLLLSKEKKTYINSSG